MFPHSARRSSFRTFVAIIICVSLLPFTVGWSTMRATRRQSLEQRVGTPRPGKPEGVWPSLDDVQREGDPARAHERAERTGPPPIPSTLRSPKVPLQPWNGRRVGDTEPQIRLDRSLAQTPRSRIQRSTAHVRRAHAPRRVSPPPVPDDQFIQNFFTWALLRAPGGDEPVFWNTSFVWRMLRASRR